ncbi:hypothetical protein Pdsh_05645 [Pyrodictium delaneyi]|uniref:Uncharacterized protein n=2 Tax=Pyrodictium delaneyi TaxID=1273541 RepID=A0A211YQ90_9CREN|nr:hypothetical protein Pdsh_05645 [Pyrodictium delaneyi]
MQEAMPGITQSYSSRLMTAGIILLIIALLASLASMMTKHKLVEANPTTLYSREGLVSIIVARLLGDQALSGSIRVNLTIYNNGGQPVEVHILPYTNTSAVIGAHNSTTFTDVAPLDNIVLKSSNSVNVTIEATAIVIERPYASLAVASLALFLGGSAILSLAVVLRLSGIED